ncbi:MAG: hypothetical protein ACI4MO_00150 [Christensenellales bacterium]
MNKKISKWHRLDNSAKIYPMMEQRDKHNLFRITFVMKQDVAPDVLQKALELTLTRFPSFKVKLKKGFFWYYFDTNDMPAKIYPLDPAPLRKVVAKKNNGYCFKISYYNRLITGDFFHALCDGVGASCFMKSLVYTYVNLLGYDVASDCKIMTIGSPVQPSELEDSFLANYKKVKIKDLNISSLKGDKKNAYLIKGIMFEDNGTGIIHVYCPIAELLAKAKEKGCTATELLTAIFILSIYEAQIEGKNDDAGNIQIFCPINLRKIFNSNTLLNFSLFSRISANPHTDMDIDTLISIVHDCLQRDTDKELLSSKISTTVMGEKFFLMRIMPLFIKQFIFKISNLFFGKNKKTATFSNIGILQLPDGLREHVESASVSISVNQTTPISLTALTTYDTLCLTFTRCITDTAIEQAFVKHLQQLGIDVSVNSNMWEVNYAL